MGARSNIVCARMQSLAFAICLAVLVQTYASPVKFDADVWVAEDKFEAEVQPVVTPLRRYTSGSGTTGSGTTSPPTASPTASPTPAATVVTTINQDVTLKDLVAADYQGAVKTLYERGYGIHAKLFDATKNAFKEGCTVNSAIARRATKVTFTAVVPAAHAVAATAATSNTAGLAQGLVAGMQAAKTAEATANPGSALSTSFNAVTIPSHTSITAEAPKISIQVKSGVQGLAASWFVAAGLAFVALRH